MDFSFDIRLIYRQYRDLVSGHYANENENFGGDNQNGKMLKVALAQLSRVVETKISTRVSILEEIYKLMLTLDLRTDFAEFSRFYNFVFFICRENGQKSITVSRAVMAWRLVLAGRFRLLNEWCSFIESYQRYSISEDTWHQVLTFSRCVHENLEGYDPDGAWPILIDEFAEHLYRIRGLQATPNFCCTCGDSEPSQHEDTLPDFEVHKGLKSFPGSKRKFTNADIEMTDDEHSSSVLHSKRQHVYHAEKQFRWDQNMNRMSCNSIDDCAEMVRQSSPRRCNKSQCAVEGCLSKGFAGLLSVSNNVQLNRDRRVTYI